jgi:P4 family phage/plasmid primase-like protien
MIVQDNNNNSQAIKIDGSLVEEHIKALSYSSPNETFVRGFYPKDNPKSNNPNEARKAQSIDIAQLEEWQRQGRGIYIVVNGGGHKDKDVKECRAVFIEHDNLDKETQLLLWEHLELPEPTIQIDSGGKSIHSYWVFDQPIEVEQWRSLQKDLLEYADGDRSLKNPSRVMRLAGAWHISSKGCVQTRIVTNSGKRYSYSELRNAIPEVALPLPKTAPTLTPYFSALRAPLTCCLTRSDRALIEQGISEGGRNSNGAKLARNLIGTANRLHELGIAFDGEPRQLFDDYCARCNPALDEREADAVWRSAEKDNPTPSLTDDALAICARAYERRTAPPSPTPSLPGRIKNAVAAAAKQILPLAKSDRPPADIIAREIAEEYKDKFKFNDETHSWMHYEVEKSGTWATQTDDYMESLIKGILDTRGIVGYGSHSYITNVLKALRCTLITRKWDEVSPTEFLPFINGVFHIRSQKLLPHNPNYHLTWQLPREYNPLATGWQTIENFLDEATQGSDNLKRILLCFCNAVIKGRADLQKFIHVIGVGGTGKGTYIRLVQSLIGEENTLSTTLEDWCGNNFETANAYRKRLVLFADEDKQTGKLGKFLSLTGQDSIRAEEKGKRAFQYRYDGMVILASNLPIFVGDSVSRITRRAITTPFNYQPPPGLRRNLEAEFEPELSAFTNYVLSIPDEVVTNTLMGLADAPEVTAEFWENRVRTDSIAAWVNDCVVVDHQAKTPIGNNKNEGEGGAPVSTLFGSYVRYCQQSGFVPKAVKSFSPGLEELLMVVLKWNVKKGRDKNAKHIEGIRLRVPGDDDHILTYECVLEERLSTDAESSAGWSAESEPLPAKDFEICAESVLIPGKKQDESLNKEIFIPDQKAIAEQLDEAPKQEPPLNSVSDDYSAAIEKKAAQSVEVPSGTGFDPAPQSGTSSGTLAEEEIEGNVELLREAIAAGDFEVVKALTSAWSIAFKQAVWSQLTQSEKEAAKALALQPRNRSQDLKRYSQKKGY